VNQGCLARDSEIGCPDAQDSFRNVLGNLTVTIRLSVGKCMFLIYKIPLNLQNIINEISRKYE
jgi:hypothetical protein